MRTLLLSFALLPFYVHAQYTGGIGRGDLQVTFPASPDGIGECIAVEGMQLMVWPNPNKGDRFHVNMSELDMGIEFVSIDLFDPFGQQLLTRSVRAKGTELDAVIDPGVDLPTAVYLVRIVAGNRVYGARLVVVR